MIIYLGREEFDDGRILNVSGGCMFARLAMILGFVISNLPDFGEVSGQPLTAAWLCFLLKYGCLAPIAANAHVSCCLSTMLDSRVQFDRQVRNHKT